MSVTGTQLPPGVEFRRATRADNAAILRFASRQPMQAGLVLRFDRSPDYFALHAAQSAAHETWLLLEREQIIGTGSLVLRPAYVRGVPETVAYLGELRVSRRRAIAGLWRRLLRDRITALCAEASVRYAYCCIVRDNRDARAAVLRTRAADDLRFEHLRGYSNVVLLARKPWGAGGARGISVRRAGAADSEPLRRFLDRHARRQLFGVVFDATTWSHRLHGWPAFGIENFRMAFDASNALVGCLAPWDASAINRVVIERMPTGMNLLRRAHNGLARLAGGPLIGLGPNSHLPSIAVTHLCIEDRDPGIFAALLDATYREVAATRRYAAMSLCLYEADALAPALRGYWRHPVPMDLYSLKLDPAAEPLQRRPGELPGFEIYLV